MPGYRYLAAHVAGEVALMDEALHKRQPVRDVVRPPVTGEQERGDGGGGRVGDGGRVVFEEVEEGEEEEEEGEAP